jgi:uncharacterized peroxidase-related enzyme
MPRINPLNRNDVPELEPFLSATEKRMSFVPNSQLVMAYKPRLLQAFSQLGQAVHDPANKTPRQLRTLVAHMASKSARCQYCVAHTGESAHNANVEDQKIAAVGQYETSPFFNDAERVALRFAQRAAAVPNAVTDKDFAALRKHYGDEEIVELVSVIAYFGFLNLWNDTLATELESSPLNFAECALSNAGWSAGKHSPHERAQVTAAPQSTRREV